MEFDPFKITIRQSRFGMSPILLIQISVTDINFLVKVLTVVSGCECKSIWN